MPILHSKDLVNWKIVNYAVKALPPLERYNVPQHGNGVWAPSIRYNQYNQTYYIYWGDPDLGVFVTTAKDPEGEWTEPQCVIAGKGMIDTTPLWDEDGKCYLVNGWANSRCQFNSVLTVREMSADGMKQIGNPVIVFDVFPSDISWLCAQRVPSGHMRANVYLLWATPTSTALIRADGCT